jgi:hypothetical protein
MVHAFVVKRTLNMIRWIKVGVGGRATVKFVSAVNIKVCKKYIEPMKFATNYILLLKVKQSFIFLFFFEFS